MVPPQGCPSIRAPARPAHLAAAGPGRRRASRACKAAGTQRSFRGSQSLWMQPAKGTLDPHQPAMAALAGRQRQTARRVMPRWPPPAAATASTHLHACKLDVLFDGVSHRQLPVIAVQVCQRPQLPRAGGGADGAEFIPPSHEPSVDDFNSLRKHRNGGLSTLSALSGGLGASLSRGPRSLRSSGLLTALLPVAASPSRRVLTVGRPGFGPGRALVDGHPGGCDLSLTPGQLRTAVV